MILNESMLRSAADRARSTRRYDSAIQESVEFSEQRTYDLFISQSFKDRELVGGLATLFAECGYRVYIDWKDDSQLDRTM